MSENKTNSIGEQLKDCEEVSSMTWGRSMRPMLRQHRDVVTIKRVDRKLKAGDVVAYKGTGEDYTLHRIIRFKKDGSLVIRGDNNYFTEYGYFESDMVGILKEFYRDGVYINCETNKKYKLYVFWIMHSYWLRYSWKKMIRPVLAKIKHLIVKK